MNKKEMICKVAEKNNMTKVQTEAVINTFLEEIEECVASGDKITFVGFGTFTPVKRAARTATNMYTNEKIEVPEKIVPKFNAGTIFKEKVVSHNA